MMGICFRERFNVFGKVLIPNVDDILWVDQKDYMKCVIHLRNGQNLEVEHDFDELSKMIRKAQTYKED